MMLIAKKNLNAILITLIRLLRLDKPAGLLLLLLPGLITLALHERLFSKTALIVAVGAFLTRSLGCIINDICDRDIDSQVQRTTHRPIARGQISISTAFMTASLLALPSLYLASAIPFESWAFVALTAILIIIYPLSKRFFIFPQLILGLTFAQSVFIVTLLVGEVITQDVLLLSLAICSWVTSYDTVYAMADYPDDSKLPIYTSVKTLGLNNSKIFSLVAHFFSQIIILILSGHKSHLPTLLVSFLIMVLIFKSIISLKKLENATDIFNWHILQGLTWVALFL